MGDDGALWKMMYSMGDDGTVWEIINYSVQDDEYIYGRWWYIVGDDMYSVENNFMYIFICLSSCHVHLTLSILLRFQTVGVLSRKLCCISWFVSCCVYHSTWIQWHVFTCWYWILDYDYLIWMNTICVIMI